MALEGIRKWLVACGATFGCTEVHPYRWPDADTRPEVPYMTYRVMRLLSDGVAMNGGRTSGVPGEEPHTVLSDSMEGFKANVRVELYNSEDGMGWLAKCGVAAGKEQAVKNIFYKSNIGFLKILDIVDETTWDDERINYKQVLTIQLRTVIVHEHKNYNALIDSVNIDDAIATDVD
jgi:hypothetical protein